MNTTLLVMFSFFNGASGATPPAPIRSITVEWSEDNHATVKWSDDTSKTVSWSTT